MPFTFFLLFFFPTTPSLSSYLSNSAAWFHVPVCLGRVCSLSRNIGICPSGAAPRAESGDLAGTGHLPRLMGTGSGGRRCTGLEELYGERLLQARVFLPPYSIFSRKHTAAEEWFLWIKDSEPAIKPSSVPGVSFKCLQDRSKPSEPYLA